MTLSFDELKHEYSDDGIVIPSVTQILTIFGLYKFFGSSDWHKERGTNLHNTLKLLDTDNLSTYDPEFNPQIKAYGKFTELYKPEWILIEDRMMSKSFRFAGTPDRVGIINGNLSVVDFKFGQDNPAYAYQTAGYEALVEETIGKKVKKRYSLIIDDDFKVIEHKDKTDKIVFLGLTQAFWSGVRKRLIKW